MLVVMYLAKQCNFSSLIFISLLTNTLYALEICTQLTAVHYLHFLVKVYTKSVKILANIGDQIFEDMAILLLI